MAEVFRAKITSSHGFEKILVIKRILPHLAADPSFVAMFIDEAKLTAQLTHPKIVQILDFGEVDGQYFIALEFIDGIDALGLLRIAAQKRVHIPRTLAVFIVSEVLDALDYAHNARDMDGKSMQIVHRDISPSNIFISRRGDVKLGDFGIAHAQRRESKTQAGTLKGKYGYMSPEQVVGRPIDARSDLFAVGVVLAELLTGRRLFTAPNDLDVLLMVRDVQLDRLDKYGADMPPRAGPHRPPGAAEGPAPSASQTAAELRDELSDYLFAAGQRVGPSDLRAFTGTLLRRQPRRGGAPAPGGAPRGHGDSRRPRRRRRGGAARRPGRQRRRPLRRPRRGRGRASPRRRRRSWSRRRLRPGRTAETAWRRRPPASSWPDDEHDGERSSARRLHAGVAAGRRRQAVRRAAAPGCGRPATTQRRRAVRLGGAQAPARQRGRRSASSRRCASSAIWRWPARPASCTSSSAARVKEIFLVGGAPESVSSSDAGERFGEYLVGKRRARAGRPGAGAQHAAPLQRQAGRHAGGAGAAASARRVPAAVASRCAIA